MRRGECAKTAQAMVGRLQRLLGLDGWDLDVIIGPCTSDAAVAEVNVLAEYLVANLVVDERRIRDNAHLLTVLCHEVCHVATFPFEAFHAILCAAVAEDSAILRVLTTAHTQAIERVVTGMEPVVKLAYEAEWGEA